MAALARTDLPHGILRTCRKRSGRWSEAGAELIEFAFVLPLLLLVIVGIFDFGFLFQRYEVVTNAAREGARAGVLPDYQGQTPAVEARVRSYLNQAGLDGALAGITVEFGVCDPSPCAPGSILLTRVTVTYQHTYLFLGPIASLVGGNFTSVQLRAVSTMRRESL
jgi:Flp pilus assembly protein TadG